MALVRIIATLCLTAAVSGCSTAWPDRADRAGTPVALPGQIEPIHAAAVSNGLAVFWVSSNGCTAKDDLRPIVSGSGNASTITLRRIAEDRCKTPLDDGFEVIWSFEELGLKPGADITIDNPYLMPAT